jgi:hypothetical protein
MNVWQATLFLFLSMLLLGAGVQAEKSPGLHRVPVGKPRAPVRIRWSPAGNEPQLVAELLALEDFDEMVLRLVLPDNGEQYQVKRIEEGRRGQHISVSWDDWPERGIPRLVVTMSVRGQTMEHSLAYPVRSVEFRKRLAVETSRHHRAGRVDDAKGVVVLPAADSRLP